MTLSPEVKEWLTLLLAFGGGISGLTGMILLLVLYFRLTRKYDAMFPEYDRVVPLPLIMGTVARTGYYAAFIVFKNLINGKRHKLMRDVTNGYDFRGNASLLDIMLSYSYIFFALTFTVSIFIFVILTKIFGIDL